MFENILLEQDQKELLSILVEGARNVPRDRKQPFLAFQKMSPHAGSTTEIHHPGLGGSKINAYMGDIEILIRQEFLSGSYDSYRTLKFDVTPQGFAYYEQTKRHSGQPARRIETTIKSYFDTDEFRQKYSNAYQKWVDAEEMLWASDSERQLTTIGHLCREALQEFATYLVDQYQPSMVDKDKAHIVSRIRSVLEMRSKHLGDTEKPFLDALLAYWGTVSDLVQRQEHGGQKEGNPLIWEDGRRVVFQTAIVMFEIDKCLSRVR